MNNVIENEVTYSVADLIKLVWTGKWVILTSVLLAGCISVWFLYKMPDLYASEAILSPTSDQDSKNIAGQLGGLASLAGINLASDDSSKAKIAVEVMRSRKFINDFVERHNIQVDLIAGIGWDHNTKSILFDSEIYDQTTGKWVREVKYPFTPEPSEWEIYQKFREIMTIEKDPESGVFSLSIEHISPILTQQWVTWLIEDINQSMRNRDREKALERISYLTSELQNAEVASMQKLFYALIEEQLKNKMLADVTPEYIFEVIDPPVVNLLKTAPKRTLIALIVIIISGFISTFSTVIFLQIKADSKK